MRLRIKVLNGKEYTIAAVPSSTVWDVKIQVSSILSVPVEDQKLLFKGKSLANDKKLSDYSIGDDAKLIAVIKKSSPYASDDSTSLAWQKLHVFLQRHFTEQDSALVLEEFKKNFRQGLMKLSLDDIERLAAVKLKKNEVNDGL